MSAPTPDETILGILACNPGHGYQLLEHFNHPARLGRIWSMSTSQVYSVLKRLESEAYVVGKVVAATGAPARTEYSITPAGEKRLQEWLFDPQPSPSIRRVRIEFLSKLYIAELLGLPADEIIHNQQIACRQQKKRHLATVQSPDLSSTELLAASFISGQLNAAIAWLDLLAEKPPSFDQETELDENR
jgi:DNA-binding PadR family transcriptional regulator